MKRRMKSPFSFKIPLDFKQLLQKWKVVLGLYFFFLIPVICACLYASNRLNRLNILEGAVAQGMARLKRAKQLQQKGLSPPFFSKGDIDIREVLESIVLLKTEKEALEQMMRHPDFFASETIKKKFEMVTKKANRLSFFERNRVIQNGIEEVELIQNASVEVNVSDLKAILSAVENGSMGSPFSRNGSHIIVKEFHLNRKKSPGRETYGLQMHLIKRGDLK